MSTLLYELIINWKQEEIDESFQIDSSRQLQSENLHDVLAQMGASEIVYTFQMQTGSLPC